MIDRQLEWYVCFDRRDDEWADIITQMRSFQLDKFVRTIISSALLRSFIKHTTVSQFDTSTLQQRDYQWNYTSNSTWYMKVIHMQCSRTKNQDSKAVSIDQCSDKTTNNNANVKVNVNWMNETSMNQTDLYSHKHITYHWYNIWYNDLIWMKRLKRWKRTRGVKWRWMIEERSLCSYSGVQSVLQWCQLVVSVVSNNESTMMCKLACRTRVATKDTTVGTQRTFLYHSSPFQFSRLFSSFQSHHSNEIIVSLYQMYEWYVVCLWLYNSVWF